MKFIQILILAVLFVVPHVGFSQETTTGEAVDDIPTTKNNVLIVPFEPKMYFSDIDSDLGQGSDMNFHEIKAKFRAELDKNIFLALKTLYNPLSFYTIDQQQALKELGYIYNSIGYKYEIVEPAVVEKENKAKKMLKKIKKKEEKTPQEAKIQKGEIVSQVDNREKFMKTIISNEKLIPNLNKQYNAQYYIFINQLDIKKSADDQYKAAEELYKREVKVHFTIFDNNGKEVNSGLLISRFNSNINDIDKIIRVHFPLLAEQIVASIGDGKK